MSPVEGAIYTSCRMAGWGWGGILAGASASSTRIRQLSPSSVRCPVATPPPTLGGESDLSEWGPDAGFRGGHLQV